MAKKKDAAEEKTKTTHERNLLKCQLSQEELLQYGDELATALDNLRNLQEEKESVVKEFKAREAAFEATIGAKQLLVRNKYEHRQVDCHLVLNYTKQTATLIRLDTGDIIKERAMTQDEKQMELGFDEENKETEAA